MVSHRLWCLHVQHLSQTLEHCRRIGSRFIEFRQNLVDCFLQVEPKHLPVTETDLLPFEKPLQTQDEHLVTIWGAIQAQNPTLALVDVPTLAQDETSAQQADKVRACWDKNIDLLLTIPELNLNVLGLTTLPPEIAQLTRLNKLTLENNQLKVWPAALDALTSLRYLSLRGTELSVLPDQIGRFTALTFLNLNINHLSALPSAIGKLASLTSLYCMCNPQLTALPDEIGALSQLRGLSIARNALTSLPETIGQLVALEKLDASENQLTYVPNSIGNLRSICDLCLGSNPLCSLPEAISHIRSKAFLSVVDIPMKFLPFSVQSSWKKVFNDSYFPQIREKNLQQYAAELRTESHSALSRLYQLALLQYESSFPERQCQQVIQALFYTECKACFDLLHADDRDSIIEHAEDMLERPIFDSREVFKDANIFCPSCPKYDYSQVSKLVRRRQSSSPRRFDPIHRTPS